MEPSNGTGLLNEAGLSPALNKQRSKDYIRMILKADLPKWDQQNLDEDLRWDFILNKHLLEGRKARPPQKKKAFLTRAQRKALNLLRLPRSGWNYNDAQLKTMRRMWKEYARSSFDLLQRGPGSLQTKHLDYCALASKLELLGADITVVRSKVPSNVGIAGTVVLETRSTFQIVTSKSELKCLLKQPSVFSFTLDHMVFTFFGKNMVIKPNEKGIKKIKSQMVMDL